MVGHKTGGYRQSFFCTKPLDHYGKSGNEYGTILDILDVDAHLEENMSRQGELPQGELRSTPTRENPAQVPPTTLTVI